jgi:hypothetical protein
VFFDEAFSLLKMVLVLATNVRFVIPLIHEHFVHVPDAMVVSNAHPQVDICHNREGLVELPSLQCGPVADRRLDTDEVLEEQFSNEIFPICRRRRRRIVSDTSYASVIVNVIRVCVNDVVVGRFKMCNLAL